MPDEFVHIIGPLTDPARYGGDPRDACAALEEPQALVENVRAFYRELR